MVYPTEKETNSMVFSFFMQVGEIDLDVVLVSCVKILDVAGLVIKNQDFLDRVLVPEANSS